MLLTRDAQAETRTAAYDNEMNDSAMMIERRRGLRIRQYRPVKIFESSLSRYYAGHTRDISSTGLRIEVPASIPIQEGKVLSIFVGHSDPANALAHRRQMVPARVIWVDPTSSKSRDCVTLGIEFLNVSSAQLGAA